MILTALSESAPRADPFRQAQEGPPLTGRKTKRDFTISGQATPEAVRDMLAALRAHMQAVGAGGSLCGTVELCVAEALNNIVEHAYAGQAPGLVWLTARSSDGGMTIELRDKGRPLPGLSVPRRQLPDASGGLDALPEGGFGWFLIHDLTRALSYARRAGQNLLTLEFGNNPG